MLWSEAGALIARGRLTHQYPHSWRSKKPIIFRNTPQWFISMGDHQGADGLRAKALKAIDDTRFVPAAGQTRLRSMIEQRPDWVISRQARLGRSDHRLSSTSRQAKSCRTMPRSTTGSLKPSKPKVRMPGSRGDAAARFLGNEYSTDEWEQVGDILDVWFDSGSTHTYVLDARDDLQWPASVYLEGTDQHRGWFHSSLLGILRHPRARAL